MVGTKADVSYELLCDRQKVVFLTWTQNREIAIVNHSFT